MCPINFTDPPPFPPYLSCPRVFRWGLGGGGCEHPIDQDDDGHVPAATPEAAARHRTGHPPPPCSKPQVPCRRKSLSTSLWKVVHSAPDIFLRYPVHCFISKSTQCCFILLGRRGKRTPPFRRWTGDTWAGGPRPTFPEAGDAPDIAAVAMTDDFLIAQGGRGAQDPRVDFRGRGSAGERPIPHPRPPAPYGTSRGTIHYFSLGHSTGFREEGGGRGSFLCRCPSRSEKAGVGPCHGIMCGLYTLTRPPPLTPHLTPWLVYPLAYGYHRVFFSRVRGIHCDTGTLFTWIPPASPGPLPILSPPHPPPMCRGGAPDDWCYVNEFRFSTGIRQVCPGPRLLVPPHSWPPRKSPESPP